MKQIAALLSVLVIISVSEIARADLLIEPMVSYQLGGYEDLGSGTNFSFSGLGYGARLGFDYMNLLFGLEYRGMGTTSLTNNNSNLSSTSSTISDNDYGVFAGLSLMSIRLVATYFVESDQEYKMTFSDGSTLSDSLLKGTGYKIGAYYTVVRFLSLGVEFYQNVFTQSKDKLAGDSMYHGFAPAETEYSGMVTLSFPITL